MRSMIIAGNWKMNKDLAETKDFLTAFGARLPAPRGRVGVIVCPPYTSLALAADMLRGTGVGLGAQDMSEHDDGAYTGEVSWKMLASAGCDHVILGHSERRQYHGETDERVNRKALLALAHGLTPILCVGETLAERDAGSTSDVVTRQVRGVLHGLSARQMQSVILAYEPVWAIGTGKNATPEQAQEVHAMIRGLVRELFDEATASGLTIQYGGSVKPDNASGLLGQADIDGALVGGACLKVDSFVDIIRAGMDNA